MGKNFFITESRFLNLLMNNSFVTESDDVEDYDDLDFQDAFITLFRSWLQNKIGDKSKEVPFSYLIKKYGREFLKEFGETLDDHDDSEINLNRFHIRRYIANAIKKGKIKLPTLRPKDKFTEKFKRPIEYIINSLNIPPYYRLDISEPTPYTVNVKSVVDFPEFLKADLTGGVLRPGSAPDLFARKIRDLIGIEEGRPYMGNLDLNRYDSDLINVDPWVKNVLNKVIKPEIKKMPMGDQIKSMRLIPSSRGNATLKISWKSTARWGGRHELKKQIINYLESLGYKNISIEID